MISESEDLMKELYVWTLRHALFTNSLGTVTVSATEETLLGGFYTVGTTFCLFQTNGVKRQ